MTGSIHFSQVLFVLVYDLAIALYLCTGTPRRVLGRITSVLKEKKEIRMIEVSHGSKQYSGSDDVVRDVSFEVKDGVIFGLLNNHGKTTLMQMIATLLVLQKCSD